MTKTQASAAVASAVTSQGNQTGIEGLSGILNQLVQLAYSLAPEYSATATYAQNAKVIYDGKVYKAKQAIQTAEPWTAAHWEEATIA